VFFRELEDLQQQGYADYQSGQQHLGPYAVPKRGCGILVKDVQSLVEPSFLPVSQ
jgi:hypothetical protein